MIGCFVQLMSAEVMMEWLEVNGWMLVVTKFVNSQMNSQAIGGVIRAITT